MEWVDEAPSEYWKYKHYIISNVRLVDLAKEVGLQLTDTFGGQFSHKTICPFHQGKGARGKERTASFYISDATNSFYCFGCGEGSNVIDFLSKIEGSPPSITIKKLAMRIGLIDNCGKWDELKIKNIENIAFEPRETIEPYLFEISSNIRLYIKSKLEKPDFEKEFRWAEKVAAKVDNLILQIDIDDCEYVKDLVKKVNLAINKRK